MHHRRPIGLVALALLVSGCIASEHGLCPPEGGDQAAFDPALLGDWTIVSEGPDRPKDGLKINLGGKLLRFERGVEGSKAYLISATAEDGKPSAEGPAMGHLVPIGTARFLDVVIGDPAKKDEQRHALFKLAGGKDAMTIHLMSPWYFWTHPTGLATTTWSVSGRIPLVKGQLPEFSIQVPTLAARTPELRKFAEEHANDPELWPADWTIECRRPAPRPGP